MSSTIPTSSKSATRRCLAVAAAATVLAGTGLALAPGASAANGLGFTAGPENQYGTATAYAKTTEPCLDEAGNPGEGHVGFYREQPNVSLAWRTFTGTLSTSFTTSEPGIYSVQAWCGTEWLGRAKIHLWEGSETTVPGTTPTTVPGQPTTTIASGATTTVPDDVTTTTVVDVVVEGKTQTSGTTSASAAKPVPSTASYAG